MRATSLLYRIVTIVLPNKWNTMKLVHRGGPSRFLELCLAVLLSVLIKLLLEPSATRSVIVFSRGSRCVIHRDAISFFSLFFGFTVSRLSNSHMTFIFCVTNRVLLNLLAYSVQHTWSILQKSSQSFIYINSVLTFAVSALRTPCHCEGVD